jgi:hypothetical protein
MTPLVICAIIKNEGPYLKEWIEFHRLVGVKRFYLYNNLSADATPEILQPYIDEGIVDLTDWPIPSPQTLSSNNPQLLAYDHFLKRMGHQPLWAAFIDVDEFLFSPAGYTVPDMLDKIQNKSAVGVNWMCFGANKREDKTPGLVMERFIYRPLDSITINRHIKSIIWLDQNVQIGGDPHFFHVEHGTYSEDGILITGPFCPPSTRLFRINHYKTKSKSEWIERCSQGKADNANYKIDWDTYNEVQDMVVEDHTISRWLPAVKRSVD